MVAMELKRYVCARSSSLISQACKQFFQLLVKELLALPAVSPQLLLVVGWAGLAWLLGRVCGRDGGAQGRATCRCPGNTNPGQVVCVVGVGKHGHFAGYCLV